MSKLMIALIVVTIVYAAQACKPDSCHGKPEGSSHQACGPSHSYYTCQHYHVVYSCCQLKTDCWHHGHCMPCGDSCAGKPNGRYPSVNRGRPYYYSCSGGQLYYEECQPFQVFNPWRRQCECFDGVCLHGNGWKSSFCRGRGWRVLCRHGYAVRYRKCRSPRPHVCCHTHQCVSSCHAYSMSRCCCE